MTMTPSNMLPLGTQAPSFKLNNVSNGDSISPATYAPNKPMVVAFICNHCPFVVHIIDVFTRVANTYEQKGISFIAISANDIDTHPADAPDLMQQFAQDKGFNFPYCYDESQEVAKAYDAACTPDLFLFNEKHQLAYRGQFDSSRPKSDIPVTGTDLIAAMDSLLAGTPISEQQVASIGCNIKWKAHIK